MFRIDQSISKKTNLFGDIIPSFAVWNDHLQQILAKAILSETVSYTCQHRHHHNRLLIGSCSGIPHHSVVVRPGSREWAVAVFPRLSWLSELRNDMKALSSRPNRFYLLFDLSKLNMDWSGLAINWSGLGFVLVGHESSACRELMVSAPTHIRRPAGHPNDSLSWIQLKVFTLSFGSALISSPFWSPESCFANNLHLTSLFSFVRLVCWLFWLVMCDLF